MTMPVKRKKSPAFVCLDKKLAKESKYAFGPAVRKMAGIVNTGIGNLSMREGFGD